MPDASPVPVETQRAYEMIQSDAIAHIASMKNRMWTITHYALLLLVSLLFLPRTPFGETGFGKGLLVLGAVGIFLMWATVTLGALRSMREKRERLHRLYQRFRTDACEVYGGIKSRRTQLFYDWPTTFCLGVVVVVGMVIVAVNAYSGLFLPFGSSK